jgi:hypothetical protein
MKNKQSDDTIFGAKFGKSKMGFGGTYDKESSSSDFNESLKYVNKTSDNYLICIEEAKKNGHTPNYGDSPDTQCKYQKEVYKNAVKMHISSFGDANNITDNLSMDTMGDNSHFDSAH